MSDQSTSYEESHKPVQEHELDEGVSLRPHVYDGIQEYDQRLPNWWLWTFYIMIIVFVVYWVGYYSFGAFRSDVERLDEEIARIDGVKAKELEAMMSSLDDKVLWEMSRNTQMVAAGKETFLKTCNVCHGDDLSAKRDGVQLPGLPLNDAEWKYGGKPLEIFNIVTNGSPDKTKGMVAWEPALGANKVAEVVAFVLSHHKQPADTAGESPAPSANP